MPAQSFQGARVPRASGTATMSPKALMGSPPKQTKASPKQQAGALVNALRGNHSTQGSGGQI
jgi:hypothetical protein